MKRLALILWVTLTWLAAYAADSPKPVLVKATCDRRNLHPAAFFVARSAPDLKQIRDGPNLSDNGKIDVGLTINMVCAERDNVIGVASVYGMAKCLDPQNCHHSIDGSRLNMLMCDPSGQAQCGKEQFREGTVQGARVCLEQIELTVKFAVIEVAHLPIT
jgi:hypothetical protein